MKSGLFTALAASAALTQAAAAQESAPAPVPALTDSEARTVNRLIDRNTGLASQESARLGNALGVMGVSTGILATIGSMSLHGNAPFDPLVLGQMGIAIGSGTFLGHTIAKRIEVTDLPQLTAAFHSVVGLAAVREREREREEDFIISYYRLRI